MAPRNTTATEGTEGTEKKAKANRAPQKRVFHVFYKTSTTDGSPVPDNVKVEIVTMMTDARKVVEFMDSPDADGLKRYKHEIVSNPRGEIVSEGAASE